MVACEAAQGANQAAQKTLSQETDVRTWISSASKDAQQAKQIAQSVRDDRVTLNDYVGNVALDINRALSDIDSLHTQFNSVSRRVTESEHHSRELPKIKASAVSVERHQEKVERAVESFKEVQKDQSDQISRLDASLRERARAYEKVASELLEYSTKVDELSREIGKHTEAYQDCISTRISKKDFLRVQSDVQRLQNPTELNAVLKWEERFERLIAKIPTHFQTVADVPKQSLSSNLAADKSIPELTALRAAIDDLRGQLQSVRDNYLDNIVKDIQSCRNVNLTLQEDISRVRHEMDAYVGPLQKRIDTVIENDDQVQERLKLVEQKFEKLTATLKTQAGKEERNFQALTQQLSVVSRRVESLSAPALTLPTPPSASPTPQMQQISHVPSGFARPLNYDNNAVSTRLTQLSGQLQAITDYVNRMPATLEAQNHAIFTLNNRYNNLSSEPMVRAMVLQMQQMYPYASNVQAELASLRSRITELEKLPADIDLVNSQLDQHVTRFTSLEAKILELENERVSNDIKYEKWASNVRQEHIKLKEHMLEQYLQLKQHTQAQYDVLDQQLRKHQGMHASGMSKVVERLNDVGKYLEFQKRFNNKIGPRIAYQNEEHSSGVAKLTEKVDSLKKNSDSQGVLRSGSDLSIRAATDDIPGAEPKLNLTAGGDHNGTQGLEKSIRQSTNPSASVPEESDRENLLMKFTSSAPRRDDSNDSEDSPGSDTPLAGSSHSLHSAALGPYTGLLTKKDRKQTSGRRKRYGDILSDDDLIDDPTYTPSPASPSSRRKIGSKRMKLL